MPERICAFIAVTGGVRRATDPDAIEDQEQRAHLRLKPDRMPRGLHFDGVENPIRIFHAGFHPII